MDPAKYRTSDWLIVAGGAAYLIGSFLDWVTVEMGELGTGSGGSAFDFFFTGIVPWLLLVGAAVVTILRRGEKLPAVEIPWHLILLGATLLGAALVLVRFVDPGLGENHGDAEVSRAFGLVLCAIGGVVAAAGGVLGLRGGGGDRRARGGDRVDDPYDQAR